MYDLQVAAEPLPGGSLLLWTSTWIWLAALAVSPVIHVLFPDGRLLSRRWAGVIWLALASMALAMAAIAVAAWPLGGPELLEGPLWGPELDPPPPLALLSPGQVNGVIMRRRHIESSGDQRSGPRPPAGADDDADIHAALREAHWLTEDAAGPQHSP